MLRIAIILALLPTMALAGPADRYVAAPAASGKVIIQPKTAGNATVDAVTVDNTGAANIGVSGGANETALNHNFYFGKTSKMSVMRSGATGIGYLASTFTDEAGALRLETGINIATNGYLTGAAGDAFIATNGKTLWFSNNRGALRSAWMDSAGDWGFQGQIRATQNDNTKTAFYAANYYGAVAGATAGAFRADSTAAYLIKFFYSDDTTVRGSITPQGTTVAFNTSSDQRLKEDAKDFDGVALVKALHPIDFKWKETGTRDIGFFAQEVHTVVPNAVKVGGADPKIEPWQLDYSKLVPVLTKAIKEQQATIDDLKARIASLESK